MLRVRVRVRLLLLYSELTPTDLWCNMLRDFTWTEKYEEAMSDENPPSQSIVLVSSFPRMKSGYRTKFSDFLWYFVPFISVADPLLKNANQHFYNFIDFSDSKKYWIDLVIFVLMDFLKKFVSVLSSYLDGKNYWTDSIISKSRNWLLIKLCPTFLVIPLVTSLNYILHFQIEWSS